MKLEFTFTKVPYLFWWTQRRVGDIEDDRIRIGDRTLEIVKIPRWKFAIFYYLPALAYLAVFNRYDFQPSPVNLAEWVIGAAVAITLILQTSYAPYLLLSLLAVAVGAAYYFADPMVISYAIKYAIVIFVFVKISADLKQRRPVYAVFEDGKLVSHLVNYKKEKHEI